MLAKNEISDLAFDHSAIFDIKTDNWTLHHQSGAMTLEQLTAQYLAFNLDGAPTSFLFLETSVTDNNVVKYIRSNVHKFMKNALSHCESHSKLFDKIWEGKV